MDMIPVPEEPKEPAAEPGPELLRHAGPPLSEKTLRDDFAASCLNGAMRLVYEGHRIGMELSTRDLARCAYEIADAMLEARHYTTLHTPRPRKPSRFEAWAEEQERRKGAP